LDDDAKAFFTTTENFAQLQDNEPSSQRVNFDRSTGRFAAAGGEFVGINTIGGPTRLQRKNDHLTQLSEERPGGRPARVLADEIAEALLGVELSQASFVGKPLLPFYASGNACSSFLPIGYPRASCFSSR
jgi:hypothetical protein